MIRTAFYTVQKYFDGILPDNAPEEKFLKDAEKAVLEFEKHMSKFAFHQCTYVLDSYIRNGSKYMSKNITAEPEDLEKLKQALANLFHIIKTAGILLHPLAPFGTEKLREYLQVDEKIFSWDNIFEPLTFFTGENHKLKFLPPRTDFFTKHESQFETNA